MADPLDNTDPLDSSSPAPAPSKKTVGKREGKGFLLSSRKAPTDEAEAEDEWTRVPSPELMGDEEADGADEPSTPKGKLKAKKKVGKKEKKSKGSATTPKAKKGSSELGEASPEATPPKKGVPSGAEGMISRRPGGLNHFFDDDEEEEVELPDEPEAAGSPARKVSSPSPATPEPEAIPRTWGSLKERLPPASMAPVEVKRRPASRLVRALPRSRKAEPLIFEPRAKLAYYGSIGGGFGTPRIGFAPGQFNTPTWMATQDSGTLVVSSTFAHEVQVLTPRGAPYAVITEFMGVSLHDPQGIVIHHDQMFIADGGNGRILKYQRDTRGNFQPILATQTGLMDLPQGLAYDDAGKNSLLFVVCGRMNRVHVLDAGSLRRLFSFGGETEPDPRAGKKMPVSCLNDPTCIAIYNPPEMALDAPGVFGGRARKLAYVTDTENDRLAVFSMDGDFVAAVGRNGRMPGEFVEPLGLCIRDQQLFVAEGGRGIGGRLQVLQPDGTPLLVLPAPTGGRLVGVHWHESRLYVSEIEAHRLHSFKIVA